MKRLIISILIVAISFCAYAQNERKIIREGVKDYEDGKFTDAEIDFRNALEIDSTSLPANYNIAGSLYKQERYDEASEIYNRLSENIESSDQLANTWHNLGNSFVQKQDYEKAIESYKNSLRLRPSDQDTKYNLAYAQSMLKKQEQEKQDNEDNEDKEDKEEEKEDEKEDEEDKENKEDEEDDNKDQEDKKDEQDQENKDDEQEKQQSEPSKEGISKEEMERMLQAVQQQEKKVLDKVEKEKAKAAKVKTDKDW